jgi:hypothetical protein
MCVCCRRARRRRRALVRASATSLHPTPLPPLAPACPARARAQAIRKAPDAAAARAALCAAPFRLSEAQAEGVLGLTLRRLTALEAGKLAEEKAALAGTIQQLQARSRACGARAPSARRAAVPACGFPTPPFPTHTNKPDAFSLAPRPQSNTIKRPGAPGQQAARTGRGGARGPRAGGEARRAAAHAHRGAAAAAAAAACTARAPSLVMRVLRPC